VNLHEPSDDRSPIARAVGIAYSVIGVCTQMVVPVLAGCWLDRRLGTRALYTILGTVVGVVMGTWGLIRVTQTLRKPSKISSSSTNGHEPPKS